MAVENWPMGWFFCKLLNAHAQSLIRAPGWGGLCLDISNPEGRGVRPGANVIAWTCHGGVNQKFTLRGDGTISAPGWGGLCLDISNPEGRGVQPGANVIAWNCHGGSNQSWQFAASAPNQEGTSNDSELRGLEGEVTSAKAALNAGFGLEAVQLTEAQVCAATANLVIKQHNLISSYRRRLKLNPTPRPVTGRDCVRDDRLAQEQDELIALYKRRLGR